MGVEQNPVCNPVQETCPSSPVECTIRGAKVASLVMVRDSIEGEGTITFLGRMQFDSLMSCTHVHYQGNMFLRFRLGRERVSDVIHGGIKDPFLDLDLRIDSTDGGV